MIEREKYSRKIRKIMDFIHAYHTYYTMSRMKEPKICTLFEDDYEILEKKELLVRLENQYNMKLVKI